MSVQVGGNLDAGAGGVQPVDQRGPFSSRTSDVRGRYRAMLYDADLGATQLGGRYAEDETFTDADRP